MEFMKNRSLKTKALSVKIIVISLIFTFNYSLGQQIHQHSIDKNKSIELAVALSLQPLPIDFGNFYAGNSSRAILYTAGELGIFIPTVVMIANGRNTSESNRTITYSLIGTYLLIKIISAFDAGIRIGLDSHTLNNNNYLEFTTLLSMNFSL